MIFDIRKDTILFVFKRCEYNDNKILISEDLSFLSTTSFITITQSFKFIAKNKLNENDFDMNSSKDIKKRSISIFKAFKKKMIQKFDFLDIAEIDVLIYYYLIRNKENRLFSLTMNKIYNIFIEPFETLSPMKRDNRISINDLCLCNFRIKYKKCYKSYIFKNSQINNIKILISQKVLNKLSIDYYNYINIFDKSQTNILSSHRFYDYKLKFIERTDKNALFKNRIYSISKHKLEQIKKYLNKYLKKEFIVSSYVFFASLILFVEKSNKELRFCVDYKKLNVIIKKNRYFISLINEILIRIQDYKYFIRLNIIAIFNKLRMHSNNEDFIIFVISLEVYKYRVLSFELINESVIY